MSTQTLPANDRPQRGDKIMPYTSAMQVFFLLWGIAGALAIFGAGATVASILFWIAGILFFGLGAIISTLKVLLPARIKS